MRGRNRKKGPKNRYEKKQKGKRQSGKHKKKDGNEPPKTKLAALFYSKFFLTGLNLVSLHFIHGINQQ